MARYDVYGLGDAGLVVDVQSNYFAEAATRLVIPLVPFDDTPRRNPRLNPILEIGGDPYVLLPQQLSAVFVVDLSRPRGSLKDRSDTIANAIDMVLYSF